MSGSTKLPLICWDSCILLAWFNEEQDKDLEMIRSILRSVTDEKINLLLSAVSYAEVLDKAGGKKAGSEFEGFAKRPNVIVANVDERAGLKAREIREKALVALSDGELTQSVKIPDALILATAIIYHAEELHTYDPILREVGGLCNPWPILGKLKIQRPEDASAGPLFPSK